MIKKLNDIVFLVLFCGIVCLIGCNNILADKSNKSRSLSNHFKNHFHVGAAINENTIFDIKGNTNAQGIIINAHIQSPLISAGKKPKKKVVQEKPTGASFTTPDLFSKVIVANAIFLLFFN